MQRNGELWIGTSGWVYKHWLDIFYPRKLPGTQQLPFYAEHFRTVEVNFSFYRLPERKVFEQWRSKTPEGFLFAVKGSRYLTHILRLDEPEEPVNRLMERAEGLGEKLGPILFQFPPQFQLDIDLLKHFADVLRLYPSQRYTLEFRHKSWLIPEVYEILERVGAALTLPVSPRVPLDLQITAPWTYFRLHTGKFGTKFTDDELTEWAGHLRGFLERGIDAYVYFNNDQEGHAIENARQLQTLLKK